MKVVVDQATVTAGKGMCPQVGENCVKDTTEEELSAVIFMLQYVNFHGNSLPLTGVFCTQFLSKYYVVVQRCMFDSTRLTGLYSVPFGCVDMLK